MIDIAAEAAGSDKHSTDDATDTDDEETESVTNISIVITKKVKIRVTLSHQRCFRGTLQ